VADGVSTSGHEEVQWQERACPSVGPAPAVGRVLRLMRDTGLLAPTRLGHAHGPAAYDGTIIPDRPDAM
jgi:hypothetical protein